MTAKITLITVTLLLLRCCTNLQYLEIQFLTFVCLSVFSPNSDKIHGSSSLIQTNIPHLDQDHIARYLLSTSATHRGQRQGVKFEELYLWTLYVTVSHNLPCGILSFVGSLGIVHNIPTIICSLCSWRQRSIRMQVTQFTCCLLFDFIFVLSIKCFPTDPWSRSWCSQELRDQWVPSSQLTTWQASPFWHQVPAIWSWWLQLIIKVITVQVQT